MILSFWSKIIFHCTCVSISIRNFFPKESNVFRYLLFFLSIPVDRIPATRLFFHRFSPKYIQRIFPRTIPSTSIPNVIPSSSDEWRMETFKFNPNYPCFRFFRAWEGNFPFHRFFFLSFFLPFLFSFFPSRATRPLPFRSSLSRA